MTIFDIINHIFKCAIEELAFDALLYISIYFPSRKHSLVINEMCGLNVFQVSIIYHNVLSSYPLKIVKLWTLIQQTI